MCCCTLSLIKFCDEKRYLLFSKDGTVGLVLLFGSGISDFCSLSMLGRSCTFWKCSSCLAPVQLGELGKLIPTRDGWSAWKISCRDLHYVVQENILPWNISALGSFFSAAFPSVLPQTDFPQKRKMVKKLQHFFVTCRAELDFNGSCGSLPAQEVLWSLRPCSSQSSLLSWRKSSRLNSVRF